MADRPQVPGWTNINLNKPEEYSSEFVVDGNRYANVTNVSTGQRQLYYIQPISNARGLITTTNADGTVTKGSNYNNFIQNQGQTKLQNAEKANKQQSVALLSNPNVSTKDEKTKIKDSGEFKSTSVGSNASNGGTDLTDASNPLFGTGQTLGGDSGVKGANLKYPADMQANQDHIVFEALEYQARALGAESEGGGAFALQKRNSTRGSLGSVRLPIQGQIADSNAVNWGQDEMDPVALMGAKTFLEGAKNGFGAAGEVVGDAAKTVGDNPEAAKTGAVATLLAQAIGKPNVLSRTTGAIVNPNMELLFQGPSLRPFTFTFRMSARDKPEGDEIRKIIFFFKKAMAARQTKNGFFLKAPNTFRITYKCDGKDHVGINKIKECALLNCAVSYVPDGQYASRADGNLTAYEMQLQFQELEPVYYDDYEGLDSTIGY